MYGQSAFAAGLLFGASGTGADDAKPDVDDEYGGLDLAGGGHELANM
jgi:hypothetical protein